MKKYIKFLFALMGCIIVASCDNYLDVKPENKFLEEQVFSTKQGISDALNGIYGDMISNNGYGGNLTLTAVELLGQRYKPLDFSGSSPFYNMASFEYEDPGVQGYFSAIWGQLYTNILTMNNFLEAIEEYPNVLSEEQKDLVKGEVYGLRAMHHLDLLRLFGPIYSTNATDEAIPYYTKPLAEATPFLSAEKVMELILDDLNMAEMLLTNDPVRTAGPQSLDNELIIELDDKFILSRNNRMNYYAVKALQARANLYAGDSESALVAAKAVIDEASQWFPWTQRAEVFGAGNSPDRIMSKEVLFSTINTALYSRHNSYFAANLSDAAILTSDQDRLDQVFEGDFNDYRYTTTWFLPSNGAKDFPTFFKYAEITDTDTDDLHIKFMQPLIRITEMYYIAAETEPNLDIALGYLNTVRNNRGLISLDSQNVTDIQIEIMKEYQKEFYGEGQLFFYYKRLNIAEIPNGLQPAGTIDMGVNQYVVPIPRSETDYR
ncbi:RagB/SusD family nutrient uptake outer membrane protein [Aestuariibaculum sediminum]|uniref:RagB/SusD family nutrient uptake outer membrane protein n=1 Tax=Aestuariibaculum sediminum TaxID=2770637 RepID=A0A8J6Q3C9_9FLAO|nr:RagB/SusD family nutrient uptake outer membrane protein [Aestuariibaculum sediminum]MBD0833449.1 RagB/SusD family nutrient uptake outer membrane protein [Aestuariibaculum sediminum]